MTNDDVQNLEAMFKGVVSALDKKDMLSDSSFEEDYLGKPFVQIGIKPFVPRETEMVMKSFRTGVTLTFPHLATHYARRGDWQVLFVFDR